MPDIVKGGFDAGVRFADDLAQDSVAVPIGPAQRYAVVGSPAYLAAHGRPATPQDLATHRCIRRRFPGGTLFTWHFARDGESASIVPRGPLTVNDAHIAPYLHYPQQRYVPVPLRSFIDFARQQPVALALP